VSSSVQRPRTGRYRSGVSRMSIVGTPASVHGSKMVGVACLESMNWVRMTGDRHVYLSHFGGCTPDHVIWLATLLQRGVRDGIIVDAYRASHSRVRGSLWKALYVQDEDLRLFCLVSNWRWPSCRFIVENSCWLLASSRRYLQMSAPVFEQVKPAQ
jgi:hypothetical protein